LEVSNPNAFDASLKALRKFKSDAGGQRYKGRFVQIFLALKCFQSEVPSMYSGGYITTEVLQTLLDDIYEKASKPLDGCVLSLFEGNFLPRTGIKAVGKNYPANNWRNNFNLQKGVGCFASSAELSSPTFLDQNRALCPHLLPGSSGGLKDAHCALNPSGAKYRSESHRKWLRIDPGGNGYAVVDILNTDNFSPYVAPKGNRIPIVPLLVALYHDPLPGTKMGNRFGSTIELDDFCADFSFSLPEFDVYFDQNPNHPLNDQLLKSFPELKFSPFSGFSTAKKISTSPSVKIAKKTKTSIPTPKLGGTPAPPPNINTGWDAEQYVAKTLEGAGWTVHDVSRQSLGYDMLAKKGSQTSFVEVKSSLSLCSPSLTAREWLQAKTHKMRYVLAILENFDPSGNSINSIYWVKDPATICSANASTITSYTIPRSEWVGVVVPFSNI